MDSRTLRTSWKYLEASSGMGPCKEFLSHDSKYLDYMGLKVKFTSCDYIIKEAISNLSGEKTVGVYCTVLEVSKWYRKLTQSCWNSQALHAEMSMWDNTHVASLALWSTLLSFYSSYFEFEGIWKASIFRGYFCYDIFSKWHDTEEKALRKFTILSSFLKYSTFFSLTVPLVEFSNTPEDKHLCTKLLKTL